MFTNLICLGVEKSGTTSLYNFLKNSKDIFAIRKETEFYIDDIKETENLLNLDLSNWYISPSTKRISDERLHS